MRIQLTVRAGGPVWGGDDDLGDRQVVVECGPGTRVDALAAALAASLGVDANGYKRVIVDGHPLPAHATVGMPPLLDGAVVDVSEAAAHRAPSGPGNATDRWELRVESGPDVGRRLVLPPGTLVVGRDRRLGLRIGDPGVSRRHAEVTPSVGGVRVRDLGGANGTTVDGRAVGSSPVVVAPGDRLQIGSTSLSVHPVGRERHLPGDGEGHLLIDPATAPPSPPLEAITLPGPPPDREHSRFPWLALLVPLVLAGVLAAVMRSPAILLFGLGGPVLSFGTWVTTRRGSSRRTRDEAARARAARLAVQVEVDRGRAAERQGLRQAHPTLAALLTAAETRSRDLWAEPGDGAAPGALQVCLGGGSPPSRLQVSGETTPPLLAEAPVTVDVTGMNLVALRGSRSLVVKAATNLVCRLGAQRAPHRVEIYVVVGGAEEAAHWSFARLLPHVLAVTLVPSSGGPASATVGGGADAGAGDGVPWLDRLTRPHAHPDAGQGAPVDASVRRPAGERDPPGSTTHLVVFLDGGPAMLHSPAARTLARLASDSWITLVSLGEIPPSRIPAVRTAVVSLVDASAGILAIGDEDPVGFAPDLPGAAYAWRLARALAPLREVDGRSAAPRIPRRVRLLDLLSLDGAPPPSTGAAFTGQLVSSWKAQPRSTQAVLGVTTQGRFVLDLRTDGPHALVAGTTGSGKSELLQTLVASLALVNRPDEMAFVLVDYKGGAAFRGCAELPHVVGWVTDLDAHLTRRALLSLGAEVRRRERILASAGVPDLDAYQSRRDGPGGIAVRPALPRLVIVIDEFRVLAEELPDFVPGLVRLAAVGRSLGIHLVIATQRPGGIVTADIRANVSLRIALRVRDRSDSMDIIERPDAAAVAADTPGRAFLKGGATNLTELQTAQVTGGSPAAASLVVSDVTRWWERPQPTAARPAARSLAAGDLTSNPATDPTGDSTGGSAMDGDLGRLDLHDIVTATGRAAQLLGVGRPPAPWLPPLPGRLDLADLAAAPGSIPVGMVDLPDLQAQECWCWPMDGHLAIAGGPGSGRTTALRTLAGAIAAACPPTAVHLYAIGPPSLGSLAELPHTAAVAGLHDADHAALVVEGLISLVRERTASPEAGQRARLVMLVDGWEQLAGLAGGSVSTELRAVLEAGRTVGVVAVVTGGRALLSGQLAGLFSSRLVLRVADSVELALAGVPVKAVPVHQPPGRAVEVGSHQEVQIALLGGSTDEVAQDAELVAIAGRWRTSISVPRADGRGVLPKPVRRLPTRIRVSEVAPAPPNGVLLGVREGDLRPVHLSLGRGHRRFVVAGPPGSGRTTTLVTLVSGLVSEGHQVAVVGTDLATRLAASGARSVLSISGPAADAADELIAARRAHPSLCVLVDDVERPPALEAVLREVARLVDDDLGLVVAATTPGVLDGRLSPLVGDLERGGAGVLLWPRPGSRQLGTAVPHRASGQPDPPGRGLLVLHRTVRRIQVADSGPDGGT